MIADLKPYPENKESGLPWLGQVPKNWHTDRLKNWVTMNAKVLPENTDKHYEFDYLDIGSVGTGWLAKRAKRLRFERAPSRARRVLQPGDTIVSTVRTYLKAVLTVEGMTVPLIASTGFAVLTPSVGTQPRFVGYLALSERFISQVISESVGIAYPAISETKLGNIAVAIPPPAEQVAIARFLDWVNGRLERASRMKRRVISLLNEQKQAIIHRAVTRGLDPAVLLKPSGIPWLGDIPKHWEVRRAKYLFHEVDERSIVGNEELLSVSHLTGVTPRSQKVITMFKAKSYVGHKLCRPGDLVVNTMWAWAGALGISAYSGIVSPSYAVYRSNNLECYNGSYVDKLLRTRPYVSNIVCHSTGLRPSRLRLYPEEFLRLPIIQPPIEEQQRIVESIDSETASLQSTVSYLKREIELIRQYRTRLIADVVTGKLDVRKAAEQLLVETTGLAYANATLENDELIDDSEPNDEEARV